MRSAKRRLPITVLPALVLALSLTAAPASAGDPEYVFIDLGTLGGPASAAFGLNDARQVVGWANVPGCTVNGHPCRHAFLWEDGVMTDLGLLAGDEESVARAINNNGLVVGTSESGVIAGSGTFHGVVFDANPPTPLPTLGLDQSFAHDVNDLGTIVGHTQDPVVIRDRAVSWQGGAITNLGDKEGHSYNRAYGVSPLGLVVGFAWNLFEPNDAILWNGASWITIGGTDGPFQNAEAYAVNDDGLAVGLQAFPSGSWHAAVWRAGQPTLDLGVLPGHALAELYDVNGAGQAVGRSYQDSPPLESRAIWFDGTTMRDLNELLPAGVDVLLYEAREINEQGDIAGSAVVRGELHAFLLAVADDPWTDLGGSSTGIAGDPALVMSGSLTGGSALGLSLTQAPPSEFALLWVATSPTPFAALGGTVHAVPYDLQELLVTDGAGAIAAGTTFPAAVPPGSEFTFQFVCQDLSTLYGLTLSNGVRGVTP